MSLMLVGFARPHYWLKPNTPETSNVFQSKKNGSQKWFSAVYFTKNNKANTEKKYELVNPFKCRIAKLAESVFKNLAFIFLYEIGYFSAKTSGDATICTKCTKS